MNTAGHLPSAIGRIFYTVTEPASDRGSSSPAPIVLFHDSLGCVALWREFPGALANATGRSVIAYDRPGFGDSDPCPHTLTRGFIEAEPEQAFAALCDYLEINHFIAFGHSVGGAMAAACAATYPDRCQALITESAQAFVEAQTLAGIREARTQFAQPGQVDRLRKYHGDKAPWVLSAWIDTWLSDEFRDWTLDGVLKDVRCPSLALHGDSGEFGSAEHPRRYSSRTSGRGDMHLLPGCGHVPHREQEDKVLGFVSAFLNLSAR